MKLKRLDLYLCISVLLNPPPNECWAIVLYSVVYYHFILVAILPHVNAAIEEEKLKSFSQRVGERAIVGRREG